jgi:trimeric autotransporter adhesin
MTKLTARQKVALLIIALCVTLSFLCPLQAQQAVSPNAATALPRLVRFNGTAKDANGSPLTGVVGITFALYSEQSGGASLWMETQNIQADVNGHYTALLGASKPEGLPTDLFTSEQARWVGVQISGEREQARVLLVSAPYALKAGDAETVGGLPASAFALANSAHTKSEEIAGGFPNQKPERSQGSQANADVTGKGTIGYLPMWDTTSDIIDSLIFQKSSEIGIGTKTPAATLDVSGKSDIRDTLTLFPKGKDSALTINGTAFKIDQTGTVTFVSGQTFPGGGGGTVTSVGSGSGLTGGPITKSGTLSIATAGVTNAMLQNSTFKLTPGGGMTGGGSVALGSSTSLGLQNCSANQVLEFVSSAWTCASAGTGTIAGVTAGTDLTGGGTSGKVTLNLDTTKVPQLAASNGFVGSQTREASMSFQ